MSAGQFKPIRAAFAPPTPPATGKVKLVRPTGVPEIDNDEPIGGPAPAPGTGAHRKPTTGLHRKPTILPAPGSGGHAKPATPTQPGSGGHVKPATAPGSGGHAKPDAKPGSAGHRKPTTLPSGSHTKPTTTTAGHWQSPNAPTIPATTSYAKPSLEPAGEVKPATGSHTRPATDSHTRPATGSHTKPATGSHARPTKVPATARHARPFRPTTVPAGDMSMPKFVAAVLATVVLLSGAAFGGRKLEPVEVVEEPPAWSYDRDAALLAQAPVVAPVAVAPPAEPAKPEAVRVAVVVTPAGEIAIGEDDVTTEEVEAPLTISPDTFDTMIKAVHQDDAAQTYWLDLVDGRRIELDAATAKAVLEVQPYRMTYAREGEVEQPPVE